MMTVVVDDDTAMTADACENHHEVITIKLLLSEGRRGLIL